MISRSIERLSRLLILLTLAVSSVFSQSGNGLISGSITDPAGAAVPGAKVTLKSLVADREIVFTTGEEGFFTFPNLAQGEYEISVAAPSFRPYSQKGITVALNGVVRVPISLKLGTTEQAIEVQEDASQVNFETPEVKGTITKEQIQDLPLMVSGGQRSSAAFVTLLPGVNGGAQQKDAFNARFNGGQQWGDEAVLDGVTMVEGLLSQSGAVALQNDFPIAPEAVGEISVLMSNYDARYGATSSAVLVASTKAGSETFHGTGYSFFRNEAFNATPWGNEAKPVDRERDFGWSLAGPMRHVPIFSSGRKKSYFFVHNEYYRSSGATTKPILTVPTDQMKSGDFSQWPYPIYDPTTSRTVNGVIVRDQFMGCDGAHPNVICPTNPMMTSSLAQSWLKLVPSPNRPGIISNYESPNGLASGLNASTDQWDLRGDMYWKDSDHFILTYHYRGSLPFTQSVLPAALDTNNTRIPNYSHVARFNWDHIFTPTLLNHFAVGYLDLPTKVYNASDCCVSQLPQIAGVYNHAHASVLNFGDSFNSYSGNADFFTKRPTWAGNDSMSWIKGRHTIAFGAEYRSLAYPTQSEANGSGTFNFNAGPTSLLGQQSGYSMASFLLGTVSSANVNYYSLPAFWPKAWAVGAFVQDTFKATNSLTVTYGARWDRYTPSYEGNNKMSFFDPSRPNPGANGLPGALVFAGKTGGDAAFGAPFPEKQYNKAFAPRVGIAYSLDSKTSIRAGYGIFFMQDFYPGWNAGVATDGFNLSQSFSSTDAGLTPAFLLQSGVPQNFQKPPFLAMDYLNGQNAPNYRPADANRLPYAQQWNLSIERQISANTYAGIAYVANKGTRLVSQINPLNAINPTYLSMGAQLNDQFTPGMTSLDGVKAPYAGWAAQMTGCAPSVAQALRRFPQYCSGITGANENLGNSTYHSLQAKIEKRMAQGLYAMANFTWSKNLTDADSAQSTTNQTGISPFQMHRNKGLASSDIPYIFNASATYELPFGKGQRFLHSGSRLLGSVVGGWNATIIYHATAGQPLNFSSGYCNIPGQFAESCLPGVLAGSDPFAQDVGHIDVNKPLFNKAAFEPASSFNYYAGSGSRMTNLRAQGSTNVDFGLHKNVQFTERFTLQLRGEAFNLFNNHYFTGNGTFNNDVSSPSFGMWNGGSTPPRNMQVGAKFLF